jgi:hypothetical protein
MRLIAPLLSLAALAVAGCGAGPRTTETRSVAPFDRIEVDSSIDVDVVPGAADKVLVTAGKNVLDHVATRSSDGVLHLSIRDRGIVIGPDPFDDARVQVSGAALRDVRVQGSSELALGRIDARETVGNLIATIEGSGDADLRDLAARTATVSIQGSGDVRANVRDQLDVSIQGSGDVSYRGNPRLRQHVSGSGDVHSDD